MVSGCTMGNTVFGFTWRPGSYLGCLCHLLSDVLEHATLSNTASSSAAEKPHLPSHTKQKLVRNSGIKQRTRVTTAYRKLIVWIKLYITIESSSRIHYSYLLIDRNVRR